jgi:DmsE family decaheme c-type cytochrome
MRHHITIQAVGAITFGLMVAIGAPAPAGAVDRSEDCAMCHEEIADDYLHTVHAVAERGGPTCTTCHGSGTRHMDEGGDPSLIRVPEGRDGERMCTSCHQDLPTMFSSHSVHSDSTVWCGSCHNVHATPSSEPPLLKSASNELCASCHPSAAGSFAKPFGHDLDRGGLECVSCHNPHAGAGAESLKLDRSGDSPCVTCHAEKRGPFVFPHVSDVAGSCLSCHEPHGSSNPMALTRPRVDQLCLECHSLIEGGTFGSQPPSFHDLRSPRYRNCTTCHVAVHGSNTSPMLLK